MKYRPAVSFQAPAWENLLGAHCATWSCLCVHSELLLQDLVCAFQQEAQTSRKACLLLMSAIPAGRHCREAGHEADKLALSLRHMPRTLCSLQGRDQGQAKPPSVRAGTPCSTSRPREDLLTISAVSPLWRPSLWSLGLSLKNSVLKYSWEGKEGSL